MWQWHHCHKNNFKYFKLIVHSVKEREKEKQALHFVPEFLDCLPLMEEEGGETLKRALI